MRKSNRIQIVVLLSSALALLLLAVTPGNIASADDNTTGGVNDGESHRVYGEWESFYQPDFAHPADGFEYWRLYTNDAARHSESCMCSMEGEFYRATEHLEICSNNDGRIYGEQSA